MTVTPSEIQFDQLWENLTPDERLYLRQMEQARLAREQRDATLNGLLKVIGFLSEHPEFPIPNALSGYGRNEYTINVTIYGDDSDVKTQMKLRELALMLSPCQKTTRNDNTDYPSFGVERQFGAAKISVLADRSRTCNAKVVGQRVERRTVVKREAEYEEADVEVDIIKWECDPILGVTE